MNLTRNRFRVAIGVLICAMAVLLFFCPGKWFQRLVDGSAWLFIGGMLCFVPEFHFRFSWFGLVLGLLMAVPSLGFTLFAIWTLFGNRPHGLFPFYELIGIGPLLVALGILAFDRKRAGQVPVKNSPGESTGPTGGELSNE